MTTKHCPRCDRDVSLDDFPNNSARPDGKGGWCRECMRGYTQEWKKTNPETNAAHSRLYRLNKKLRPA